MARPWCPRAPACRSTMSAPRFGLCSAPIGSKAACATALVFHLGRSVNGGTAEMCSAAPQVHRNSHEHWGDGQPNWNMRRQSGIARKSAEATQYQNAGIAVIRAQTAQIQCTAGGATAPVMIATASAMPTDFGSRTAIRLPSLCT